MKFRVIIYSILAVSVFMACDDDLSSVGLGIQPEKDRVSVQMDTIPFTSSTQIVDSIYTKTSSGLLGNFYDPTYGEIQYGYLCNFYTAPSDVFKENVIDNRIDSVILRLEYTASFGDPLTTMEAAVYGIQEKKTLERYFYSNVDPWQYAGKNLLWAKKAYTAHDVNISDSLNNSATYVKSLSFHLPDSVGQRIYDKWKDPEGKEIFANLDKFFEFFPGVYIESTYGFGNILNIIKTDLEVYYNTYEKDKQGTDSLVTNYALFTSSEEVTQLNKFKSKESGNLQLVNNTENTFLKTPAGVVTQLEIDLKGIIEKIGDNRIFNNVRLTLEVEDQKQEQYTLAFPPTVVLMNPDSIKPFFEEARVANNVYSYSTALTTGPAYRYTFGNISNIIEKSINHLKKQGLSREKWPILKLWVIPVNIVSFDSYQTPSFTTHRFLPSGATLKKEDLKLYITTSKRN